ncbi:MAG: tRNA (guanosine(37)-N1)-methyltransferase TrmD, partial [Syntrophales bacterium]
YSQIVLICGHYEGVDERVVSYLIDREISIGDYVLTGGELSAMVVIDAVSRLLPGVLGNCESASFDSFSTGLLEYPHYTRPAEYRGWQVPDVLLSGNHQGIQEWRRRESLRRTFLRRPDLLEKAKLSRKDVEILKDIKVEFLEEELAG